MTHSQQIKLHDLKASILFKRSHLVEHPKITNFYYFGLTLIQLNHDFLMGIFQEIILFFDCKISEGSGGPRCHVSFISL